MRTSILLIGLLALPAFASQTVWKWVDDKGVVHLSDREVPGATKMEVSTSNTAAPSAVRPSSNVMSPTPPVNSGYSYRSFQILKPVNEQSFINTGGQVSVSIRLEPSLQPGHRLVLVLDGSEVTGFPRNVFQYDLKQVPRGSHTAKGEIRDDRGTTLQESAPVVFLVRQESIAQPPVGPTLKPPPKPRS
jgi:hypothetical protein